MTSTQKSSIVHRTPFFYGWVIAVVATLGIIMTNPGQTPVISIFIDRFIDDLGISRSLISSLYLVGTVVGGLSLSVWGRQIDRHGPRLMTGVIAGLLGVACLYMGFVQNAVMLGFGFVLLRMLGQGGLSLVSRHVVNQWWVRRRGLVVGLTGVAAALLGMGLFPNIVHSLLGRYPWRITYAILGGALLLGMAPLSLALLRDRPEDYGLEPDRDGAQDEERAPDGGDPLVESQKAPSPERDWTLERAVRTPSFWVVAVSFFASAMLGTGLYFHMVDIFDSRGLAPQVAAAVYVPISVTSALVRLGSGYLADRIQMRYLMTASMGALTLVMVMAQVFNSVPLALLYGVLMGVNGGLSQTIGGVVWASYFGRRHLGAIAGLASTISVIGSALGPLPLGLARDLLGSYNTALLIEALLPVALAIANLVIGRPTRHMPQARAGKPSS
ncbi:MAG: MFS transporter [Anaerolineae bacterium]